MRALMVLMMVAAAACSKSSSNGVAFVEPPATPTAVGLWIGDYDPDTTFRAETVPNGGPGGFRGGITWPGSLAVTTMAGDFDGQHLLAISEKSNGHQLSISADYQSEPTGVQQDLGFLFEGQWVEWLGGEPAMIGEVRFRVTPVD